MPDGGPGTGTNYEKRKWNTTFRSEIPTGETGPPFYIFHLFWEFSRGMSRRNVFHTAEPEIPEIWTKWKAPFVSNFSLVPRENEDNGYAKQGALGSM